MAFVDVYGEETTVTSEDAWLDVVDELCVSPLQALLPPGVAWSRDADTELTAFVRALSYEFSRVKRRGRDLLEELDLRTTFELLADWERIYGLPECTSPVTLDGRRAALQGKRLGYGDPTHAYFLSLVVSLGYYDPEILTYTSDDIFTCLSPCNDPLYTETWRYVWDVCATSLGAEVDAALSCVIDGLAPLHTLPRYRLSSWTASPTPSTGLATGLAYHDGLWVLVGADSGAGAYIATSINDGLDWVERVSPKNFLLQAVRYANGLWVAVGNADGGDAYIITSTDGVTWTERANPKNFVLTNVAYGGGLWVAVGEADGTDAYLITSTDGITWTERVNPKNVTLVGVVHTGSLWVAVGFDDGADSYIITSTDGITWTERANPDDVGLLAVTHDGAGTLVAVGYSDGTKAYILTSTDGVTWTQRTNPKAFNLESVIYHDGLWIAVGQPDGADAYLVRSTDGGVTWVEETNPENVALLDLAHNGAGLWMAVGGAVGNLYVVVSQR